MRLSILLLGFVLAACASDTERPAEPSAPAPAEDADSAPDPTADALLASELAEPPTAYDWTASLVDVARADSVATLQAVRTGTHDAFDRVVFAFAERVPGYHIEYVDRPVRQCGSGAPIEVAGDGWLEVRLRPARAHTDAGEPTVAARDRRLALPLLRQLTLTCDFEADVTWVLGLASPNAFRVAELSDPPRLVVDVQR